MHYVKMKSAEITKKWGGGVDYLSYSCHPHYLFRSRVHSIFLVSVYGGIDIFLKCTGEDAGLTVTMTHTTVSSNICLIGRAGYLKRCSEEEIKFITDHLKKL